MHGKIKDKGRHPQCLAWVMEQMVVPLAEMGSRVWEDGELTLIPAGFETHKWKHLASSPYMDRRWRDGGWR